MATLHASLTALAEMLPLASWNDDGGPGWIFGFAFWIALIAVAIMLLRGRGWFRPGGPGAQARESGAQILERRFAEGQLSAEEYRERRGGLDEGGKEG